MHTSMVTDICRRVEAHSFNLPLDANSLDDPVRNPAALIHSGRTDVGWIVHGRSGTGQLERMVSQSTIRRQTTRETHCRNPSIYMSLVHHSLQHRDALNRGESAAVSILCRRPAAADGGAGAAAVNNNFNEDDDRDGKKEAGSKKQSARWLTCIASLGTNYCCRGLQLQLHLMYDKKTQ